MEEKNTIKKPKDWRTILLAAIAVLLLMQVSVSSYALYRDVRLGRAEAANRAETDEALVALINKQKQENNIAIEDFLSDYKRDVYNKDLKTIPEQQIVASEYFVQGFLYLAKQYNNLLDIIVLTR